MKSFHVSRPSPGLIVAVVALFVALSGVAVGLPGKNTVDSGDVKKDTLKGKDIKESTLKIPSQAVTGVNSGDFFLSRVVTLDRPLVPGSTCDAFDISAPGIQATDHVLVTPPPTWAFTFTLVARPAQTPNAVTVSICNVFTGGGAGDPDGNGGSYKLLVIR